MVSGFSDPLQAPNSLKIYSWSRLHIGLDLHGRVLPSVKFHFT